MGWKIFDYKCPDCGHEFESMEKSAEDEVLCPSLDDESPHPCNTVAEYRPSANLGFTNDKEKTSAMLKKRSEDHTRKEQKSGNMLSPRDLPKL